MAQRFEIIFEPHFKKVKYRMQVDVVYRSEQVVRFRVHAGEKYIILEKHLLSNRVNPWKVPETNIDLVANGIEMSNYTLYEIQERLEAWLNKDNQRPPGNVKYEH